jgi:hypothetical protein
VLDAAAELVDDPEEPERLTARRIANRGQLP